MVKSFKSKTKKSLKNKVTKKQNKKMHSFKPRMYRMKVRISKKNLNNIAKITKERKSRNNGVSFNTIGLYVENRKSK